MADAIISRKDARAQGLTRYFTGRACPHGHLCPRLISTFGCVECVRIKSNSRNSPGGSREPKNPFAAKRLAREEARARGEKRYLSCEPCEAGHVAERYVSTDQCSACLQSWKIGWREANRDKFNAQSRALRAADPQKYRDRDKAFRSTPHGRAVKLRIENKRRARKLGFTEHYTPEDVQRILRAQHHRCAYCRVHLGNSYEVDHITPLARGGADDRRNIQIVCAPCNRQKQAKDPIKHARDLGLLI